MSSFVAKVLQHAGHFEKQAVQEQLDVLTNKLSELEVEVHQLAENKYVLFVPCLTTAENLNHRVQETKQEILATERKINAEIKGQLSVSTGEFQTLNQQLSQINTTIKSLDYLADFSNLLQHATVSMRDSMYGESAKGIYKLEQLLKQPLCKQDDKIEILKAMKSELYVQMTYQHNALSDAWNEYVKWSVKPEQKSDENERALTEVSVCVQCVGTTAQELIQLVQGNCITGEMGPRMKVFAERCQKYLLSLVLENSGVIVEVNVEASSKTLVVKVSSDDGNVKKKKSSRSTEKRKEGDPAASSSDKGYEIILSNLVLVLQQLHDMLLHIEYSREELSSTQELTQQADTEVEAGVTGKGTLMSLFGEEIGSWLLQQIRYSVLNQAVPNTAKELESFGEVVSVTKWVQGKLLELGFLKTGDQTLLDHVQNVNVLFANKKCQAILSEARDLMTAEFSDNVSVAEDKPMGEWPPLVPGGVKKGKIWEMVADHIVCDNTFKMPKCRISQTVQSLMGLAYETLSEATESSPECAVPMYFAVHDIFEIFCHVVPRHHGQHLEQFPQLAALHHNNCMFIAHHLLTLGNQFSPALPSTINVTFVDLVLKIRQLGLEYLRSQIKYQRDLLLEYMQGAEGFVNMEEPEQESQAERAIKQVLLQLGHLQNILKPVLPINIYKTAMGKLINAVVRTTTDSVSSLEDIGQSAACTLINLITPLEEECGPLLCSPGEVPTAELLRHVQGWPRLTEMKNLLGASLSDIADRWAEGKGPLAVAFTAAETKQMVRALFQNTDRRSSVLASIRG